ncbi:MAG: MalY/PatB family protein [Carnobacterium sp.]|uniref:MalY/PatB family protein n=1 Tax=Carnobacterium sp. TaxID=48221 RepID=UPI002FCCA76C
MNHHFDEVIDRKNPFSVKWSSLEKLFGSEDVLPMWVADMDFENPEPVLAALRKVLDNHVLGYMMPPDSLYEAIIHWQKERHQMILAKEDILFSPGVVPSIGLIIQTFTQVNDAVMIHDPVYTPFSNMIELNQRKCISSTLTIQDNQFKMDFADIEKKMVEQQVKLFILCNPQNPGGRVWSKKELTQLAEMCKKHDVLIISDEIHGDLVFQPESFTSLVTLDSSYQDFVLTLSAATKTFNLAGIKLSMVFVQNPKLRDQFIQAQNKIEQSALNTFGYVGTEAAFSEGGPWLSALMQYLSANLELICTFFDKELPQVRYMKPEGTYLFWFDCSTLGMTDAELADHFAKVGKIGLNAGAAYGPAGSNYMRLNFAAPQSLIEEGLKRIKYAFEQPH